MVILNYKQERNDNLKVHSITRLVKSEDLNHHGTLFAGRVSEWFVEAAFIAAASLYGNPQNIVCVKLHGLKFAAPVKRGDIIVLETHVVHTGTTSLTSYGCIHKDGEERILVEGFATFVCVDEEGRKMPHNIALPEPEDEREKMLRETAKNLK